MLRILLVLVLAVASIPAFAQPERGKFAEDIAARKDATQTYTLYLPTTYDATKKHPVLFVFDPRGRGTPAAEIFRDGAEEYGWILISSNQTQSDGSNEPNERALQALIPELGLYATDPKRLYATGFSGTAMVSWLLGIRSAGLAGVIGVGGRLVEGAEPEKFSFAHYGFAAKHDFNNREMRMIDAILERSGKHPHRFQSYEGVHSWITPELAREAIGWLEVVAGNRAVASKVFAEDVAAADTKQGLEALRRYRAILRTYDGILDVEVVRARIAAIESDPATRKELKEEEKWDEFERQYIETVLKRVPAIFSTLREEEGATISSDFVRAFRIGDLRRHASRPGAEGASGQRLLETLYAQMVHRLPPQLFARHDYAFATALLEAATTIHPDRWSAWYNLASAYALAGNPRRAFSSLEKAITAGFQDATHLETDEDFASLRKDKRFEQLLATLRQ